MSRPGTFERVYAAIRRQLCEGVFRPGDRLEPAILSEQLNASVTPVRDALHRLTGERLVEAPRHEGFRVPMLTETMLRHLYAWHRDLLLLALARRRAADASELVGMADQADSALHERQNVILLAFVEASGNPEHVDALRSVLDRLEPLRRIEQCFLDSVETEIAHICETIRSGDRGALRRSLVQYHRRRERIVPELLAKLQAPQTFGE